MSTYTATVTWKSDSRDTFTKNRYSRGHEWSFDGGVTVPASSSPQVVNRFSVEEAVDPEEALVAAASSCHMLTFLWIAATEGYRIDSYEDTAEGVMTKSDDGHEWISTITLSPNIEWAGDKIPNDKEIAAMHHSAHEQCYIANTIKSEIKIK